MTALPRVGWFSTPRVQMIAVQWELILGLWLLSGYGRSGAWVASVLTFFAFAGVSGYLGWIGVAACGCLGVVRASPWHACLVDVGVLALLAIDRPNPRTMSFRLPPGSLPAIAGTAAIMLVLTGVGSWLYGSPEAALARLRGEYVTLSSDYVDFGTGVPGEHLEATVQVWNWSDQPVKIVGGTSDCSCTVISDLPVTLPPGEGRTLMVQLIVPRSRAGAFTRRAELWTDHPSGRIVRLRIGCRIME